MIEDYMKEKTDLNSNLQNIEKTILLDKEIKKIQKIYPDCIRTKPKEISKEEQEKLQFGSYTYSTGI